MFPWRKFILTSAFNICKSFSWRLTSFELCEKLMKNFNSHEHVACTCKDSPDFWFCCSNHHIRSIESIFDTELLSFSHQVTDVLFRFSFDFLLHFVNHFNSCCFTCVKLLDNIYIYLVVVYQNLIFHETTNERRKKKKPLTLFTLSHHDCYVMRMYNIFRCFCIHFALFLFSNFFLFSVWCVCVLKSIVLLFTFVTVFEYSFRYSLLVGIFFPLTFTFIPFYEHQTHKILDNKSISIAFSFSYIDSQHNIVTLSIRNDLIYEYNIAIE